MNKNKYIFDKTTLSFKRSNLKNKIKNLLILISTSVIISLVIFFVINKFYETPKETKLKQDIILLKYELNSLNSQIEDLDKIMNNLKERDENIYRVIFETNPIPEEIRNAGFGGSNKYAEMSKYEHSDVIINLNKKIDILTKQIYIQSKSFDEIEELVEDKNKMLSSIPAIQPVSKNKSYLASGFGPRIHPIYKIKKMHAGLDFTAPKGTPVYATGDGKVEKARYNKRSGYGKHVTINHGYGYKSLYAHLDKYVVKEKQKVKRGEIIGFVGNTGRSVAPHLHYEITKNNKKINPIYYFFNDLDSKEYEKLIEQSTKQNQSFD